MVRVLSEKLYIELLTEELRLDPIAGSIRVVVPSGKCAVFDEEEFDTLIRKTSQKLLTLKTLRKQAEEHSTLISEAYLRSLGVPFKVKRLVKKQC